MSENNVDDAIHAGWLHSCDREEALIPGMMMNEFGLTKQMMFSINISRFGPDFGLMLNNFLKEL